MITLRELGRLATTYADSLELPVAPLPIGDRVFDTDREPVLMGVVNLSRDSSYRESIAVSTEAAVRMARVQHAHGAAFVDIGAESSRATAAAVNDTQQLASLLPVIEQLTDADIAVSVESYSPAVVRAGLKAGAKVVNLTGSEYDQEVFDLAAEHRATVILCHVLGPNARALDGSEVDTDPVPRMVDAFGHRLDQARSAGVEGLAIDPGLGFGFRLDDQRARAQYQFTALLHSFRLRSLGVPICHALPHSFDIFGDQFRSGEGFFAVMAHLGQTGIYRTHEVPLVRSVLDALTAFTCEV